MAYKTRSRRGQTKKADEDDEPLTQKFDIDQDEDASSEEEEEEDEPETQKEVVDSKPAAKQSKTKKKATRKSKRGKQEASDEEEEEEEEEEAKKSPPEAAVENEITDETSRMPDEAIETITDVVECLVEQVFCNREQRANLYETLDYFFKTHPMKEYEFGRLYTLVHLTNTLVAMCTAMPYGEDDEEETAGNEAQGERKRLKIEPLVRWDRQLWSEIQDKLQECMNLCRRSDVRHVFRFYLAPEEARRLESKEYVDGNPNFTARFYRIERRLLVQKALATIRSELETAVEKNEEPNVEQDELDEIWEFIKDPDYREVADVVKRIFDLGETKKTGKLTLKPIEELSKVLEHDSFHLQVFQAKAEKTLQCWKSEVLGDGSVLFRLGYGNPYHVEKPAAVSAKTSSMRSGPRSGNKHTPPPDVLDQLKKGRRALKQGHGEDPLEESRVIAQQAAKKRSREDNEDEDLLSLLPSSKKKRRQSPLDGAIYEKKKTAARLSFEDSSDEDDGEDEDRVQLGPTPHKGPTSSVTSPIPKTYNGPLPDPGVFDANGKVIKRHRWTDEEKQAVRMGVEMHGMGKWAQIKTEFGAVLRNRSHVQIKDCYRTMKNKGEVHSPSESDSD